MNIEDIKKEIIVCLKPLNPEKIILFGSFARGNPDKNSDIDLYVVTSDNYMPRNWTEKSEIYLKVLNRLSDIQDIIPVDLIAHTRPMHEKFIALDSIFSKTILRDGISLL